MKPSQDECRTRAPIHFEWTTYNWFLKKFGNEEQSKEDPELFNKFLQSFYEDPPAVIATSAFALVPFDWGPRGALAGHVDALLGSWSGEGADVCTGYERLPPDQLAQRITMLEEYVADLHSLGKVKRVMPYIDFGTQLFGRHDRPQHIDNPCTGCPPDVPQSVWGFWEFYDHWEEYAEPTGPFGLGPKPPDPTTWLARQYDSDFKKWPELPDELAGLGFEYYPLKCSQYGPTYRYNVCRNTLGWALWWKQVVQWAARVGYDGVFIDNAYFRDCWNQECQEGYLTWLESNFTTEEIRRYFTTNTTNNWLNDPGIETGWHQHTPGFWRASNWVSKSNSAIFPDTDAHSGRYSCRIHGPGDSGVAHFSHVSQLVDAAKDWRLTFYYKTQGIVEVKAFIDTAAALELGPLALADDWTQVQFPYFDTSPEDTGQVQFNLRFEVRGAGSVWLDEFWLGKAGPSTELTVELWHAIQDVDDPVRKWAAATYWFWVADEKLGYLREQARQVNPQFELFANGFHTRNVDYFMIERLAIDLNHYRLNVGFYPGLYLPYDPPVKFGVGTKHDSLTKDPLTTPLLVTNIFDYKYIHAKRVPDSFGYTMPQWIHPAEAGFYDHNADTTLLGLAEAAAFGGGAGCDPAGLRYNFFRYGPDASASLLFAGAVPILETEKKFWKFIDAHKHRYSGYYTHADVGIVYHNIPEKTSSEEFNALMDLAGGLAGRGVLWDVLTENRCNEKSFSRLRALIYQDVTRISEAEAQAVLEFIEQGGLVIAAGVVGDIDEWFRMRLPARGKVWPPVGRPPDPLLNRAHPAEFQKQIGKGTLIYHPLPPTADDVIIVMEAHLGRTVRMVGNVPSEVMERLRLNAWVRQEGGGTITFHVVNYDVHFGKDQGGQVQLLNDVQVSVPLPPKMQVQSVSLHSPEGSSVSAPFNISNGLVTFTIPGLRIYTMAVIE